ncbi:efflux RND transporter periplasmic adaptor subunit [Robbsia sp. KACC 23696]|uniref:efflux RND transporter periplasmic adaptor subunit n=1 Tax=Robbsia sp. KACC 23696 TaxID=3149231 RepID=UPI00325B6FAE
MKLKLATVGRVVLTIVVVVIAALVVWRLVRYYMFAPWTRDGHVQADIVEVAPDVTGLIDRVTVTDNQTVHKGQVLFVIDQARFKLALAQAQSTVAQQRAAVAERNATLAQMRRESGRNKSLGDLVSRETYEESQSKVQAGEAALNAAQAALAAAEVAVGTAQLNLERTVIVSPVDGFMNDRAPRAGEFVTAGHAVLSVVDANSYRVDGYFEETKMPSIAIGQHVTIHLMGQNTLLHGHVTSIAAAIADRDRSVGSNLLPNVNPSFSWVRLAQRIPVRIQIDDVPANVRLIAGRTATVSIDAADVVHGSPLHPAPATSIDAASSPWSPASDTGVARAQTASAASDEVVLPPGSVSGDMSVPPTQGRPGTAAANALAGSGAGMAGNASQAGAR